MIQKDSKGRFIETVWDNEKTNFLIEKFSILTIKEITKLIGSDIKTVSRKIRELGLNRENSFEHSFKVCTKCNKSLPKTREYFGTNKDNNSILFRSACKECTKKTAREKIVTLEEYLISILKNKTYDKRKFEGEINIDIDFLLSKHKDQKGLCAITGIEMTYTKFTGFNLKNISIDRIDSKKGYIKENIQLVCLWANVSKNSLTMEEFENFIIKTVNNLNLLEKCQK